MIKTGFGPEGWDLVAGDEFVVFQSCYDRFLVGEHKGAVLADRTKVGPWEKWKVVEDEQWASLESWHRKLLVVHEDGSLRQKSTFI